MNPSGKLPFTWFASLEQSGAHALDTYPGIWRTDDSKIIDEEYKEGIYVGYRWTDKNKVRPTFAFGHGLSYTTFAITDVRADKTEMAADGSITFTATVKNTGTLEGKEVVQLYVSDLKASVDRPVKELRAFAKVSLLPGEEKEVALTIDKQALSFYDEVSGQWVAEPGYFEALIGNASDNIAKKQKFKLQ